MSKVVGVAFLAVFGLAAGLAYYFLVIEAKKKESVKKIEEETNDDEQPARADASKTDAEAPQVDVNAEPPLPAGSPTSLDSFEVPSLPTSDCVLTDSLVIVEKHEAEEVDEGQSDHKHDVIENVQGEINLEEELNAFLSSPPPEDAKKASQEEPRDEDDEELRHELEEEPKNDPKKVDLEYDKDNSADLSDEEEVVSVVEVPPSRPTDESKNLLDKEESDNEPAEGVVEEVAEVIASTVPMESPPQVFDLRLGSEPTLEPDDDDHGEDTQVDAPDGPSEGYAVPSEPENTPESRDPIQESNYDGGAFTEQDRQLSEVEVRPENLVEADSDNDHIEGVEVLADHENERVATDTKVPEESDDEGVAGVEGSTLSEEESATGAAESRDADEGDESQNTVLQKVPGTIEDSNGKSSSDEKALFDEDVVGKKGKKKNKRKNKRKANGALVNDDGEDATRF